MANLVEILETMNKNTDDLLEEIINIKKTSWNFRK